MIVKTQDLCFDRNDELVKIYNSQPYSIEIEGIKLVIDKDVFPPDLGLTTKYLAEQIKHYSPEYALDMGCGSGFIAFMMRTLGTSNVYAIDTHTPAVDCARKNLELNSDLKPIHILKGDLFQPLDTNIKFDLIVFNQPYYPIEDAVFGMGSDGGKTIIERFFNKVANYISPNGCIIMPFSDLAGDENNPRFVAEANGFYTSTLLDIKDRFHHLIYEFKVL